MKILFTSFSYYPETSGVPIVVKYLAEGLAKLGHSVTVATRYVKEAPESEIINKVSVHRFKISSNKLKQVNGDVSGYLSFVKNAPKDVLILECFQCFTTDVLLPYLSNMNCTIFIHSHGAPGIGMKYLDFSNGFVHFFGNLYNSFYWKRYYHKVIPIYSQYVKSCICLSVYDSTLSYLQKYFESINILENAADDIFFSAHEKSNANNCLNLTNSEYCLCVANYHSRKNQLELLEEFFKIKNDNVSLVMVGSSKNSYYDQIYRRYLELNSFNPRKEVKLLFGLPRKDITNLVKEAKLILLASKWEEYPITLIEAMASGIPFISTDVGNARILPGGLTINSNISLSSLLDLLLDNDSLYRELSKIGSIYARDNNRINIVVSQLEKIISQ